MPNRDQRRRDGTFEYVQLGHEPMSQEDRAGRDAQQLAARREVAEANREYRDELDDHIAESMKDPEYAAAAVQHDAIPEALQGVPMTSQWLEPRTGAPSSRPYCVRCEVPIYQDIDAIWRREATASAYCPRNPARDGHEPLTTPAVAL